MSTVLKARAQTEPILREFQRLSPQVTGAMTRLRQEAYKPGVVPSKFKLLAAALISVTIRCEPCIRAYVEWAASKGATKEELIEFMNVAVAMQGCPGEEWALKALGAYRELIEGTTAAPEVKGNEAASCCEHS